VKLAKEMARTHIISNQQASPIALAKSQFNFGDLSANR
jgi:hypothetical protein